MQIHVLMVRVWILLVRIHATAVLDTLDLTAAKVRNLILVVI